MMKLQTLYPQRLLLPIVWKSKSTRIDACETAKKLSKVLCHSVGWLENILPITNNSQYKINPLRSRHRQRKKGITWMTGHQWTYTQYAIPQASMMSTNIRNIHQRVKPGNEYRVAHSKSSCNLTPGKSGNKVLVEDGHRSERGNLQDGRWSRWDDELIQ